MSIPIQQEILSILKEMGPMCRDDLVVWTTIPRTTVYDALKRLFNDRQVGYRDLIYGRGRPLRYWEVVR